ncbi:uncharacterized protein SAPINGB_P003992 [Magnusiomyces paraingens]|uniref:Uncharacterized protein n=1 Tax=Magnusiomyces paraingens TaxID=2606893 RepID=A0A5E8BT85_9ASCO|nr:uncharacterized protein SAPINGB_P003992 [Saprochaete ingens]VVT54271.1 unnamed protein product [Saprochaete ingens]
MSDVTIDLSKVSHIVVDWDETITKIATIHLLAAAAYQIKPELEPKWKALMENNVAEVSKFASLFKPTTLALSSTPELDAEIEFLEGLKPLEYGLTKKIEDSQIFKGLNPAVFLDLIPQIEFIDGWWDFAKMVESADDPPGIVILSQGLSSEFVRAVIDANYPENKIIIYGNDIDWDTGKIFPEGYQVDAKFEESLTDPAVVHGYVRNITDKERIVSKLKKEALKVGKDLWYFGDSPVDTLSLLVSSRGVVVNNKETFDNLTDELKVPDLGYIANWNEIKFEST